MQNQLLNLLAAREGHFRYESGYHGSLWLDLDRLWMRPGLVQPFAQGLAGKLAQHRITAVCGPLMGGALVAHTVAIELGVAFYYTERFVRPQAEGLYPVAYRLPAGVRSAIPGQTVAIVDDVISAGSAVRGTLTELRAAGVGPVVIGALLVLGSSIADFCAEQTIPLESMAQRPSDLWLPAECPLCAAHVPLEDVTADSNRFPPQNMAPHTARSASG
ncbi:MAG: orotate phosphoribosyltransferase [Anaerolineae bacterium]|nr:orotate phosphoribosyltransferase [Anaerolineae bacterium]